MVTAKASQMAARPAHPRNTTDRTAMLEQPAAEYAAQCRTEELAGGIHPIAVPLPPAGETLLISDGSEPPAD
jgi:hypothetical protein